MTTANRLSCSHCDGPCRVVDASGQSTTLRCWRCRFCTLSIHQPAITTTIPLRSFHLERGEGPWVRPLDDLRLATELVKCLFDSSPFTGEMTENFGIRTVRHGAALIYAVHCGVTAYDLDRVMGDGPAMTRLVSRLPNQPFPDVRFPSDYEMVLEEQDYDEPGWWREEY